MILATASSSSFKQWTSSHQISFLLLYKEPQHRDLEIKHRQSAIKYTRNTSIYRWRANCLQARVNALPSITLVVSEKQRSLNAMWVITMQKDWGSQQTQQYDLLPLRGSNSKVTLFEKLKSLNSRVYIQQSIDLILYCTFHPQSFTCYFTMWKLPLHSSLLHYLYLYLEITQRI